MNIFNKVTLKSMKKNRTRTLVTVAGVILSSAMITAVATFAVSLQSYMVNSSIVKYGGWHVEFLDVSPSFAEERSHDPEAVSAVSYENIGYAALDGGKNPDKPYLFIAGFSEETFSALPISLVSGRLPANSLEILVPAHVAANGGVKFSVGDKVSLAVGKRMGADKILGQHDPYLSGNLPDTFHETLVPEGIKTYTVVGICERPAFEEYSAPGYTLITAKDPSEQADSLSVFVTLSNPRKVHAYTDKTAGNYAYVMNDNVLRFLGLSDDKIFNHIVYWIGGILTALIMTGSFFLIYNSFNISLNERIQQFGILSSVGATAKQLRSSVLFEGLCVGAMGIPAGILIGIASIRFVIYIVSENFRNLLYSSTPLTLTVSISAVLTAAAASMVTILFSAYIPAKKAVGTPVMECIRQTNEVKIDPKNVSTSKFAFRIYGLEGTLALKNYNRNKKRYRSIVLSLTLSVVLFVSGSTFGTFLKQAAQQMVVNSDYDICFTTQDMDENELFLLYDQLKTTGGIYGSSYQAVSAYPCTVETNRLTDSFRESSGFGPTDKTANLSMDIQFIEDSIYLDFINSLGLPPEEYTGPNAKLIAAAKAKKEDKSKNGKKELVDLFTTPSMNLTISSETNDGSTSEQTLDLTFVDTIPIDTLPKDTSRVNPYVFIVVAPYQRKETMAVPASHTDMGLTFSSDTPSQSTAEMETIIQSMGITAEYTLYNLHKMFEQNRSILFVVNVFTYVFVIMISLITVANVFNTISANIRLRRRELAMLRSIGMSDRAFRKMMNFECIFYGARTLMFGLPAAAILSLLIYKAFIAGGADIMYRFPWSAMGISVLGVFLIISITMVYSVSKLKKENIIDAIRDDMT